MKNIQKILFIAVISALINACSQDFLNLKPKDSISDASVWADPNLVELFVNEMYRGLGHGHHEAELGSMVDESHFIHNYGTNQVVASLITPSDIGQWNAGNQNAYRWSEVYKYLRNALMFMDNINDVPFDDEDWRTRLKGEVHFLIAYYYHNLVRLHGGVPIVTRTYGLNDEYEIPRSPLKDCIDHIIAHADSAISILPVRMEGANLGRANKAGAMSLKSRILLWAASDLVHENWYGSYEEPDLVTIGGDRTAAWRAARDAAKAVIDLPDFALEEGTGDPFQDYTNLFVEKRSDEHIFSRYFLAKNGWDSEDNNTHSPLFNGPNGYAAWAGNTPIQTLVDDYEMADGTPFDWDDPTHAAAPYENRDPRFYASILYDGAPWRQRPASTASYDPTNRISIRTVYSGMEKNPDEVVSYGIDTRQGPQQTWNGTYSGYYLRKAIDIDVDPEFVYDGANQEVPWHFFRLGELYLNYAEACIELGEDDEAKKYLNRLRKRAGMPDITETGDALRQRYRNERRIEMAFEQSRYFDVRRWLIGEQVYNNAEGIVISEFSDGSVLYEVQEVGQTRGWNDRTNLLPILQDEMNRNPTLIQNPLY
ncbi:MAG: RagB/SusD family nutrient uptake outer membrane protein [Cytophagales bacterium]|nr:RagB/SusD family nutrient uptake outer membrane protein [Cytophagales bacterium]